MRQVLSIVLALGLLTQMAASGADTAGITAKIASMSLGTNIELRLKKSKERTRGARGAMSDTGFALVDSRGGERQIAFDDIDSVRPYVHKSHTTRSILIGVGITLLVLGIIGSRV
jgi:hypothetical protein